MTEQELTRIKELINKAEIQSAKAQGVIDTILEQWKKDYDINSVEEANEQLTKLNEELSKVNDKLDSLQDELLNSCDWDKLERELS